MKREHRRTSHIPWTRILLVGLVVFLVLFAPFVIDGYNRRLLGKEGYVQLRSFFDDPAEIPEEWFRIQPYSEEFKNEREAMKIVLKEWRQISHPSLQRSFGKDRPSLPLVESLQRGETLTEQEWKEIDRMLERNVDYLEVWTRFAKHPEYGISHTPITSPETKGMQLPDFIGIQRAAEIGCLKGFRHLKRGEEDLALAAFLDVFHFARRSPAEPLIAHVIANNFTLQGARSLARFGEVCQNSELLKTGLQTTNEMSKEIKYDVLEQASLNEVIGFLKMAKARFGFEFDIEPGQPAGFYFNQLFERGAPGSVDLRLALAPIPARVFQAIGPGGAMGRYFKLNEFLFVLHSPSHPESEVREDVAAATFDLSRLHLANRIREIEKVPSLTTVRAIEEDWNSVIGSDPFSGKPYFWLSEEGTFASTGPDGANEGGPRYSPTNGIVSKGDIWLPMGD